MITKRRALSDNRVDNKRFSDQHLSVGNKKSEAEESFQKGTIMILKGRLTHTPLADYIHNYVRAP